MERESVGGGKKTIGEAITRSDMGFITCDSYALTEGIQTLDVSSRGLSAIDSIIFSGVLMNNNTLTELDLSANELGAPVYPRGWSYQPEAAYKEKYFHNDGRRQMEEPEGTKPGGALAFAAALEQSGSLTKLNILHWHLTDSTVRPTIISDSGPRCPNIPSVCNVMLISH